MLGALTSSISDSIEYLVIRRQNTLDYIKRAHQSKCHWLNVVKITKQNIEKFMDHDKLVKRCRRWFYLGLSLGRLLQLSHTHFTNINNVNNNNNNNNNDDMNISATSSSSSSSTNEEDAGYAPPPFNIVKALLQLLEEYEHYIEYDGNSSSSTTAHMMIMPVTSAQSSSFSMTSAFSNTLSSSLSAAVSSSSTSSSASSSASASSSSSSSLSSSTPSSAATTTSIDVVWTIPIQHGLTSVHMIAPSHALVHGSQVHGHGKGKVREGEEFKPALQKVAKQIVYEHLQTPFMSITDHSDYCEVVHSLMDVLSLIYSKFLDSLSSSNFMVGSNMHHLHQEAILKADKKIKHLIIGKISDDLTAIARPLLKRELGGLLSHMFIDERATAAATAAAQTAQATQATTSSIQSKLSSSSSSNSVRVNASAAANSNTNNSSAVAVKYLQLDKDMTLTTASDDDDEEDNIHEERDDHE